MANFAVVEKHLLLLVLECWEIFIVSTLDAASHRWEGTWLLVLWGVIVVSELVWESVKTLAQVMKGNQSHTRIIFIDWSSSVVAKAFFGRSRHHWLYQLRYLHYARICISAICAACVIELSFLIMKCVNGCFMWVQYFFRLAIILKAWHLLLRSTCPLGQVLQQFTCPIWNLIVPTNKIMRSYNLLAALNKEWCFLLLYICETQAHGGKADINTRTWTETSVTRWH